MSTPGAGAAAAGRDGPPRRVSPDPAPPHAFALRLTDDLALRLREHHHAPALQALLEAEREHLAPALTAVAELGPDTAARMVTAGLGQFRRGDGWQADLCWRGEVVGGMGLHHLDGPGGSTEVGFWLRRAFEGRGLVTRAMTALHRHFFEARGLGRVAIAVVPGNGRSLAVARRLGYEPEAVLRRAHASPSGAADLAFHGLLAEAWRAAGGAGADADAPPRPLPRFALRVDDEIDLGLFERDDAPVLHRLVEANLARLRPWMPWAHDATPEATQAFVTGRALAAVADADGFEAGVVWRGRLVGAVGLHGVRRHPPRGEIGYWLAAEAEGHGVVARAVRAVTDKAFADWGFERVEVRADPANVRSRAVPERLGFTFEGVLRREERRPDGYADRAVYGVLREEWPAASRR